MSVAVKARPKPALAKPAVEKPEADETASVGTEELATVRNATVRKQLMKAIQKTLSGSLSAEGCTAITDAVRTYIDFEESFPSA